MEYQIVCKDKVIAQFVYEFDRDMCTDHLALTYPDCTFEARNTENEVKYPICPISMYFEGDEDKCDVSKCDFDTETRSCSEVCRRLGVED